MAERLLHVLIVQAVALSLAVVAVRVLQALCVRRLGAGAAYLCWALVPVASLAAALPHAARDALVVHVDVAAIAPAWTGAAAVRVGHGGALAPALAAAWIAGVLLFAAMLLQRQRRFERLATPRLPAGAGPAVLGVLKPRVVLPRDFEQAYDDEERRLMLLHEGVHLRRRDNAWNLVAAALLALHWFNPIAWWAARRLRLDQETACDAAVLRRESPAALAAYAGALLKAQGVAFAPPLATSWQSTHPLVERVRMLQTHRISSARHRAGLRVAALSILAAGVGGYALQAGASARSAPVPGNEPSVMTAVAVEFDQSAANHVKIESRLLTRGGQKALVRYDSEAMKKEMLAPFEIAYTATRLDGGRLQLDTVLRYGDPLVTLASPRLVTHEGEAARVALTSADGAHAFAVTFVPKLLSPAAPAPDGAADARTPPALPRLPAMSAAKLPPLPRLAAPAVAPLHALPAMPSVDALAPPAPIDAAPATPALPAPPAPQRAL